MSVDNKVPEIRFKGFSGEWAKRKMLDCSSKIGDGLHGTPKYTDNTGIYFINGNNLVSGSILITDETKQVSIDEQSKHDNSLDFNTLLLSINGTIGNLAWYQGQHIMLGKSVAFIKLENCNNSYMYAYMQTEIIRNHFSNSLTGSTIKNLGLKAIRESTVVIPDEHKEQISIGNYFQKLDGLINQHQQKYDKLSSIKKAMLEKMFPKQGEIIPEIRFKGFSGEWEEKFLNNEVELFSGLTYSPSDIRKSGTLVLRSSNVKNGQLIEADNIYVNPEVVNCSNVVEGDIIVVVRNGSRSLIGKHAQVTSRMNNTVIGAFMTGIRSKQPAFINALLDTNMFTSEVEKNLGATINQITNGSFKSMIFMFPTEDEQQEIGNYFQKLDALIKQHQQQITKLNNIKQACLSKMFV